MSPNGFRSFAETGTMGCFGNLGLVLISRKAFLNSGDISWLGAEYKSLFSFAYRDLTFSPSAFSPLAFFFKLSIFATSYTSALLFVLGGDFLTKGDLFEPGVLYLLNTVSLFFLDGDLSIPYLLFIT